MPVLLLAQGDVASRDLLKKAIVARYGLRPPALESLMIQFKGRVRARLGPIATWVPVEATGRFLFPSAMRWDVMVKAVGLHVGSAIEAFDGQLYRTSRGGKSATTIENPDAIRSMQERLWAIAAMLLTPLGEDFVRLEMTGEAMLQARNTRFDGAVCLHVREDGALDQVKVQCLNPDSERQQVFRLQLSDELRSFDDLILPAKINAFWDDDPYFELEPVHTEANPTIPEAVFALNAD